MQSIVEDIKNQFRYGSMVIQLILVNIFVYVADNVVRLLFLLVSKGYLYDSFADWFLFCAGLDKLIYKPWSIITYMFFHADLWHLGFNMYALYIFGQILVNYIGNRKILPVFILGGIAGALLCIVMFNLIPALQPNLYYPMLGASAGVMAIVLAAATLQPEHELNLLFFGPVRIKYIALFFILLDLTTITKSNPGGHIAHLGGAIFGYFFIRQLQQGTDWSLTFNRLIEKMTVFINGLIRKKNMRAYTNPPKTGSTNTRFTQSNSGKTPPAAANSNQEKLDSILDKIAKSGYESLSREEKEFLFKMSKD